MADDRILKLQQIINKLKGIIEGLIISRGYEANLGRNVYDWKVTPYGQEQIPGVSIEDPSDLVRNEEQIIGMDTHILSITVKIKSFSDAATIRKIVDGDLYSTFGETANRTLDGLLEESIRWLGRSFDFEHKDKLIGSAEISLELVYRTGQFNPYE